MGKLGRVVRDKCLIKKLAPLQIEIPLNKTYPVAITPIVTNPLVLVNDQS